MHFNAYNSIRFRAAPAFAEELVWSCDDPIDGVVGPVRLRMGGGAEASSGWAPRWGAGRSPLAVGQAG